MRAKDIFRKINTVDIRFSELQDKVSEAFERVLNLFGDQGVRYSVDVTIPANVDYEIPHPLGVVPKGWHVTDIQTDLSIWRVSWTNKSITLRQTSGVAAASTLRIEVW